jgi:hypothetical protein
MRIGILGSGLMGAKLGTLFARAGHDVVFSYARSHAKLPPAKRDDTSPLRCEAGSNCLFARTSARRITRDIPGSGGGTQLERQAVKEDAMTWAHRCLIVAAAVVSIGLSTSACATSHYTYRDTVRARQDVAHVAFDNGYRDGLTYGRRDAQARRRSAPDRVDRYRNADRGYRRSYGDRGFYQEQYRAGFERGYAEAYGRDGDRDRRDDRNR